jgi:hypothetical protein
VSPATFSQLPRQSSPCLPTLQGTCTAPRPIRHSSLHARELARRWLVRPEILRFRLSPETDPVRDPEPLSSAILYLSTRAWLALCGGLLTTIAYGRVPLQPRGIAFPYRTTLPRHSPAVRPVCCGRCVYRGQYCPRLERLLETRTRQDGNS